MERLQDHKRLGSLGIKEGKAYGNTQDTQGYSRAALCGEVCHTSHSIFHPTAN